MKKEGEQSANVQPANKFYIITLRVKAHSKAYLRLMEAIKNFPGIEIKDVKIRIN